MKNIFIGGVAKSGKSTIAEKICNGEKYNHIPIDYFTASLKRNFPDVGIVSNVVINDETSSKLSLLLSTVISIIDTKDEKFILDSAHVMPKDIIKYLDRDKWDIYYFGYPNTTVQEKINTIRKYEEKESWTNKRTDQDLTETLTKLISLSKEIQQQCIENNIPFIDTSTEIIQTIENAYNKYIKK